MQKYISDPVRIRTILLFLKREFKSGSKSLYPDSMESRFYFQPDTIMQFWDSIAQYQAWHENVIEKHEVEVSKLECSQTQAS